MDTRLQRAIDSFNLNFEYKPRRIGIEIEFAGLNAEQIISCLHETFVGHESWVSPFEIDFETQEFGKFRLELDSSQIKEIGDKSEIDGNPGEAETSVQKLYIQTVSKLAENLVPWEIVTPPLEFKDIEKLYGLVDRLRVAGALGTKSAARYAFGVHLNPEPTSLKTEDLLQQLRSFCCLYDWILTVGQIDITRRITPYIDHFNKDYVIKILKNSYSPNQTSFIEDYLLANPTRNRSLDMLPMFAYLDSELVDKHVQDDRIKSRPTFHYRMPNCEVDNPSWNLSRPVEIWCCVEELARDADKLETVCHEYLDFLSKSLVFSSGAWIERLNELVSLPTIEELKVGE